MPERDPELWDSAAPGLGLRVRSNGRKTWIVHRRYNGSVIKRTLGRLDALTVEDARHAARAMFADALALASRPREREYAIHDTALQGFMLRIQPNGARSWVFRFRRDGKPRRAASRQTQLSLDLRPPLRLMSHWTRLTLSQAAERVTLAIAKKLLQNAERAPDHQNMRKKSDV